MTEDYIPLGWTKPTHDTELSIYDRRLDPGLGFCGRCGFTWAIVDPHSTTYGDGMRGCFPLCVGCWTKLGSPEARIEYYDNLIKVWEFQSPDEDYSEQRREIARAVANGG